MRRLCLLFVIAACELEPAPKQQPAPAPAPAAGSAAAATGSAAGSAAPNAAPPAAVAAGSGAGSGAQVSQACLNAAIHLADVLISNQSDPTQRAQYEQERTNIVRSTSEACARQQWPDAELACFATTKTPADLVACEKKFPPPGGVATPPTESKHPDEPGLQGQKVEPTGKKAGEPTDKKADKADKKTGDKADKKTGDKADKKTDKKAGDKADKKASDKADKKADKADGKGGGKRQKTGDAKP